MKNCLPALCLVLLLASCKHAAKYWETSKFNMVPSALKDGDQVKLIYTSPTQKDNPDCYVHVIAISQATNDTINILCTGYMGLTVADKDKVFNYFDEQNLITKTTEIDSDKLLTLTPGELEKIKVRKRTKVSRDPNFDAMADNKFPTVIGIIGTKTN